MDNDYFSAPNTPPQRDYGAYWLSRQKGNAVVTPAPPKPLKSPQIRLKRKPDNVTKPEQQD